MGSAGGGFSVGVEGRGDVQHTVAMTDELAKLRIDRLSIVVGIDRPIVRARFFLHRKNF